MFEKQLTLFGTQASTSGAIAGGNQFQFNEFSFIPERIIYAKGSLDTPERCDIIRRISAKFPDIVTEECLDVPHNKINTGPVNDTISRHEKGKRTLVFGVLHSAVKYSQESGNSCPNYWHYSVFGFCHYGCSYCYLAGTPGVWYSPSIKVYVNLPEIIGEIDRQARTIAQPVSFYHGKLQDGLALEPLTGYMQTLIPFFAHHPFARQIILTKSATVESLLSLEHHKHTILSWSLNPPSIASTFEEHTPPVESRLRAMKQCADAGYPVRALLMPVIPVPGWEKIYADFLSQLLRDIPVSRLTIGGICSYSHSKGLMMLHLGPENPISAHMSHRRSPSDGRYRYDPRLRIAMYRHIITHALSIRPNMSVGLCLEENEVRRKTGNDLKPGICNCVW